MWYHTHTTLVSRVMYMSGFHTVTCLKIVTSCVIDVLTHKAVSSWVCRHLEGDEVISSGFKKDLQGDRGKR